ncbi:ABC transporter ATP-binding protein [Salinisphaera sp. Q1T1-3]|uniref:ABC transporter ATP-binding protein n=1 Tax=Salinisphaera sp. Q1T1-3 TaxID=2321229 RepID=UPI000E7630E2|nr:ABC transporter ATP-binding protein [Salinisphaera sp. Q1T1-3]RJS94836.1 ABC transporter ATP-binding protein [Salinisphaera sp. Q1T1-3]
MTLQVENLTVEYGAHTAVDNVELQVAAGEIVALVGPNGCGKSTLLHAIARLHRPTAGRVLLDDVDVWTRRPRDVARRIALMAQAPEAPDDLSVAGLVRFGRHPHQGLFHQWSTADEQAVQQALAETGMTALAARRLAELSGGQRQRAWLATALAQNTSVLLLDEPTSMLDPGHAMDVLGCIRDSAAAGRTVIMVMHDLNLAVRYAHRLVAMRRGRIHASGKPGAVVTPALAQALYGIEADVINAPRDGAPIVVPAVKPRAPDAFS